ncbi:CYFA0S10e02146g1_1 [Cyberlindnera fabianii]|uniref:CYFA0S10e02146g1_1 n=1 Tax=Cyberlindnera fabianii TaxID=36022 RepID=A0A061AYZ4_CYBFA|nr:CYFA0S10e02146g1_1 [Cyberlindnera fabianii]
MSPSLIVFNPSNRKLHSIIMSEELLNMFFDDEFVPHAYLDALFSAIPGATSDGSQSLTNPKNIELMQQRSATLLSHLDFYTSELTNNLETQLTKLRASNSVVSYSYESSNEKKLKPTTRLEYYIDSLSISVQSLNDTVANVTSKVSSLETDSQTTQNLLELTKAKQNLIHVQQALETIKSIVEIAQDTPKTTSKSSRTAPTNAKNATSSLIIQPSQLSAALKVLQDTIKEQVSQRKRTENDTEVDQELMTKIDDLSALMPIFKNLGEFQNVYADFVKNIQGEKEGYLKIKNLDDELFDTVLK